MSGRSVKGGWTDVEFAEVVRTIRRMCRSVSACGECPMRAHIGGCSLAMLAEEVKPEEIERIAVEYKNRMDKRKEQEEK